MNIEKYRIISIFFINTKKWGKKRKSSVSSPNFKHSTKLKGLLLKKISVIIKS